MFKSFLKKKPYILGSLFVFGVIVFSITLFLAKQQQETRSHAEKTVDLFYQPSSDQAPLQLPAGSTFTLDVYLDPGSNSVSYVKVEMDYDQTKFKPAGGFIPNSDVFSQTVEGPIDLPGKTVVTLSIGSDLSKAVKVRTKIGTLALKALETVPANTTSAVSFGSDSQALSVSNNSSFNENVIASTTPVTIQINKPQLTCGTSPSDVMLVMDRSGSMNDKAGSTGTKLSNAKAAANNFLSIISDQEANRAGLVSFGSDGTLVNPLTNDFPTLKNQVNAITINGETCISCGITKANQEIALHKRNAKNVVILLTDGRANHIEGSRSFVSESTAETHALAAAVSGHIANGTIFYTIGLGKDVDSKFLTQLAESTGGLYYFSPTTDQLNDIYTQISQILAKGSVTGTVFNDANQNGVFEPTEPGIPGVLLQLYPYGLSTPQLISTDSNGTFTIQNLCDRTFTIKQVVPSKWRQTLPLDLRGYTFTISNGSAIADKNFGDTRVPRCSDGVDNDGNGATDSKDSTCHTDGNPKNPGSYDPNRDGEHGNSTCTDSQDNNGNALIDGEDPVCHVDGNANNPSSYDPTRDEAAIPTVTPTPTMTPTPTPEPTATPTVVPTATPSPTQMPTSPTPTPAGTRISVDVLLHGIGNSGDNANPSANSLSNKSPIHTKRVATVWLYDINNNLTATASGDIQYSSTSGSFTGIVYTPSLIPYGNYSAKLNTGNHLTRLVAGIQNIVTDQTNSLPTTDVVAGDVNNDNRLDILDYNLLLGCYSDLSPALSCTDQNKIFADLNDDGGVNQFDYNLFLREISTQPGQ